MYGLLVKMQTWCAEYLMAYFFSLLLSPWKWPMLCLVFGVYAPPPPLYPCGRYGSRLLRPMGHLSTGSAGLRALPGLVSTVGHLH